MRNARRWALPLLLLLLAPAPAWAGQLFAGIEIGGRGVKVTVIEAVFTKDGVVYKRLFTDTHNTTLTVLKEGAFRKTAIADAVGGIGRFYRTVTGKYKVPAKNVFIVGSSGVPKASNTAELVAAVLKETGKELRFIDERAEVELSIRGIVPGEEQALALLLDIGGGNTKGGFLVPGLPLAYFHIPLATVTYTDRVAKEAVERKRPFAEVAEKLRDDLLVKPMREQAAKMPGLEGKKKAYLSGGIVWAMVTLTHPEEVDRPYVRFKASDIEAFRDSARRSKGKLTGPDLSGITDPARRARAEKEIAIVRKAYQPRNLVAGAEVLLALVRAFDLEKRELVFPRGAQVGWLTAYVVGEGKK